LRGCIHCVQWVSDLVADLGDGEAECGEMLILSHFCLQPLARSNVFTNGNGSGTTLSAAVFILSGSQPTMFVAVY
jgi:hypothetical protein